MLLKATLKEMIEHIRREVKDNPGQYPDRPDRKYYIFLRDRNGKFIEKPKQPTLDEIKETEVLLLEDDDLRLEVYRHYPV